MLTTLLTGLPTTERANRRLLPSRRSGLDRRYQGVTAAVERRGAGERRVLADRHVSLPHQDLARVIGKARDQTKSLTNHSSSLHA